MNILAFSADDQKLEALIVKGLQQEMRDHSPYDWDEALADPESDAFEECAWTLTNLDCIDNGVPERSWYYDTFEDNSELLSDWVYKWFGARWAKIAEKVEW